MNSMVKSASNLNMIKYYPIESPFQYDPQEYPHGISHENPIHQSPHVSPSRRFELGRDLRAVRLHPQPWGAQGDFQLQHLWPCGGTGFRHGWIPDPTDHIQAILILLEQVQNDSPRWFLSPQNDQFLAGYTVKVPKALTHPENENHHQFPSHKSCIGCIPGLVVSNRVQEHLGLW